MAESFWKGRARRCGGSPAAFPTCGTRVVGEPMVTGDVHGLEHEDFSFESEQIVNTFGVTTFPPLVRSSLTPQK